MAKTRGSKWDSYVGPEASPQNPLHGRTGTRKPYDPDTCPAWAEESVWSLTLYFEQQAEKSGFQLKAGRPVLYGLLDDRVTKFGLRDRLPKYWLDSRGRERTWDEFVKASIHEYWSLRISDEAGEYAADDFCGAVRFNDLLQQVREKCRNHRIVARAEADRDATRG